MKNKQSSNIKTRILSVLTLGVLLTSTALSIPANADSLSVANRDDVYNKLDAAAQINVIMNNLKKCFNGGSTYNYTSGGVSGISGKSLSEGKIFKDAGWPSNKAQSTSLWLEQIVQTPSDPNYTPDSAIWCYQGQDDGVGLMQQYQKITGLSMAEIVCKEGKGLIYQRAKTQTGNGNYSVPHYVYGEDKNCSSMNDTGAMYVIKENWSDGLKESYEAFRNKSDNPYLPTYDEIGMFNNTDGYFNYIKDYNVMCKADVTDSKPNDTDATALTTYENSSTKIIAKTKYYHVTENKTWTNSLSEDNPVKSCQQLLDRMHELEDKYNGVYDNSSSISVTDDRKNGYEGIILAKLKKACDEMKDQDGKPAYDNLYTKLEAITKDENASADEKQKAQESMDKISAAKKKGTYVEIMGKKTDAEGQTFQCLDVSQMQIIVNTYENPVDEIGTSTAENDENEACYAGAGAMGWLLCPVIMSLEGIMDQVYSFVEEHFLKIRSSAIFNGDGTNNGVKDAWSRLQAIANIIFIIFFIVVLFSQITGVGISNYGIKKMLPKLIVTAILINLSYIICAILVDLSNVIGVGLRSLLETGLGIQAAQGSSTGGEVSGFLVAGSITLTSIIIAVCINPGLVVTLLLFLGSAVIAVLFLWLVLVIREVIIILGIVLSPVAFACSALPNTESLFKKWIKIMQSMLILYPLCSLVVGGGQFAGRILASVGQNNTELGWTFNLAAMIAQVVPFFFIPSLLKGTLAGLGTLGAKLAQGQRALNANTMGRIRNSDRYKDFQMRSRAGMKADGTLSKRGELMNRGPFKAFNRGTNAARASYLGRKGQIDRMNKYSDPKYLEAARVADEDKAYNEEIANAVTLFNAKGTSGAELADIVRESGAQSAEGIAALQRLTQMKDFENLHEAMSHIDASGLNARQQDIIGDTLMSMKGDDKIAAMFGKQIRKYDKNNPDSPGPKTLQEYMKSSKFETDFQNFSGRELATQDDKVLQSALFQNAMLQHASNDQWTGMVAATGDLNQKNLSQVNSIISKKVQSEVSAGTSPENSVFSGASATQVSTISSSTLDAIGEEKAKQVFRGSIEELNSSNNANLRANMNANVKTRLGIREAQSTVNQEQNQNQGHGQGQA